MSFTAINERWLIFYLLLYVFALRTIRLDQPILEGYVGRQVPTAMVARNLQFGSGFFCPSLNTGPFPNQFLVEPPIDAQLVAWLSSISRLKLDSSGRLVSAMATTLAAWGLFGLVRHRNGLGAAVASVVAFGAFPVTLRYGRAFQPDAMAMGLVVAGLRLSDSQKLFKRGLGTLSLAVGLAQKVSWALVLVPLIFAILRTKSRQVKWFAMITLLPALGWYLYAGWSVIKTTNGSSASSDNASQWLTRLAPSAFLDSHRYFIVVKDLAYRAFTPLGSALVLAGFATWKHVDQIWKIWIVAAAMTMVAFFGKLHHDYYWIMMAPPAAGWVGIILEKIACYSRPTAIGLLIALLTLGIVQSRATWKTPDEWRYAPALVDSIRSKTGEGLIIAPEAILYLGDRRGCRLEYDTEGARRAANEWRPVPRYQSDDPSELVDFYRSHTGARYFADLIPAGNNPIRSQLHHKVRNDPSARILDDQPGRYLLVIFDDHPSNQRALK